MKKKEKQERRVGVVYIQMLCLGKRVSGDAGFCATRGRDLQLKYREVYTPLRGHDQAPFVQMYSYLNSSHCYKGVKLHEHIYTLALSLRTLD